MTALPDEERSLAAARRAAEGGDIERARALLAGFDATAPDYAAAKYLLAQIERHAGRKHEALTAAAAAADREPNDFDYCMTLAEAQAALEDWQAAAETSGAALRLNDSSYDAWLAHGNHRIKLGDYESAADAYRRARRLLPNRIEAPVNLASCLDRLGRTDEARDALLDALNISPDNPGILLNLGRSYSNLGNQADAIETYEKALAIDGRFVHAYVNLAIAHLLDRSPDEALRVLDRCLLISPAERGALALQLMAYQQAQRIDEYRAAFAFDELIYTAALDVPEGYASIGAFNDNLTDAVLSHPTLVHEPAGKSTRRGHQTGNLAIDEDGAFASLKKSVDEHLARFLARRSVPADHPYAQYEPHETSFYMWATVLDEQGHQTPHIHPAGWISGVYYVQVPEASAKAADAEAGWIEFGQPDIDVPGIDAQNTDLRRFAAREGHLYLFPSYFFHRTIPYEGDRPRISIAFDLIPKSLSRRPDDAALTVFARQLAQLRAGGQLDKAVTRCRDMLQSSPDHPEALRFLADIEVSRGNAGEALKMLELAADALPPWLPARIDLVRLLRRQDDPLQARARLSGWLLGAPVRQLQVLRADVAVDLGDFAAARRDLEGVLGAFPAAPDAAYLYAQLPGDFADSSAAGAIKQAATSTDRPGLHFAAARLHERAGDFDSAFTHYAQANRLLLAQFGDANQGRADVRALIGAFDEAYFARLAGAGADAPQPVFIVGLPRTGTTLVQQILAAHHDVRAFGELDLVFRLVGRLASGFAAGRSLPDALASLPAERFTQAGRAYVQSLAGTLAKPAQRWIDRCAQNYTMLGVIQAMLPGARVIHVTRARDDTILSCFANFGQAPFTTDLAALDAACDDHDALMAHWRRTLSLPLLEVRYEDLVADIVPQSRRIIEFVDLPWQDDCLEYYRNTEPVTSGDRIGVRQPVYTDSVGRSRRFATQLEAYRKQPGRLNK